MKVKRLQQGGAAPAGQPSPEEQLMGLAQELIGQLGPEAAVMLAQIIMEMAQQAAQPQAPTFARKGGKLTIAKKQ